MCSIYEDNMENVKRQAIIETEDNKKIKLDDNSLQVFLKWCESNNLAVSSKVCHLLSKRGVSDSD